jgi:hypothetical protein
MRMQPTSDTKTMGLHELSPGIGPLGEAMVLTTARQIDLPTARLLTHHSTNGARGVHPDRQRLIPESPFWMFGAASWTD